MRHLTTVALTGIIALAAIDAHPQERISLGTDLTFYGDNTEFFNPWREGETLLGSEGRVFMAVDLNDQVTVRAGVFGNHAIGDEAAFRTVRPVIALHLRSGHSRFIFGSLDTARYGATGPDQGGPHELLPPLQRETLAFTRPNEAGLQWFFDSDRVEQEIWLNWQQLNTEMHREAFDGGLRGELALFTDVRLPISLSYQFHLVHHGGQLFDSGPVGDSWAGGPGFVVRLPNGPFDKQTVEIHGLVARDVPNRAALENAETGFGLFTRWAAEKAGWRSHFIAWRSRDFVKEESDNHYGARRGDGRLTRLRHYFEAGLTRILQPADEVGVALSARIHRGATFHDYSYRILAHVEFARPIWAAP